MFYEILILEYFTTCSIAGYSHISFIVCETDIGFDDDLLQL